MGKGESKDDSFKLVDAGEGEEAVEEEPVVEEVAEEAAAPVKKLEAAPAAALTKKVEEPVTFKRM